MLVFIRDDIIAKNYSTSTSRVFLLLPVSSVERFYFLSNKMRISTSVIMIALTSGELLHCRGFVTTRKSHHNRVLHSTNYQDVASIPMTVNGVQEEDTLEKYSQDIAKVLKELRGQDNDPLIPAFFRHRKSSYTNIWNLEMWERHTSRWRYLRCILSMPNSRLSRRILPQLTVLFLWSCWGIRYASKVVEIPMTPLSLMSTFVAFLLTLRSNQGLSRLTDGRLTWGQAVLHTRDLAHLVSTYVYPKDKKLGLLMGRSLCPSR